VGKWRTKEKIIKLNINRHMKKVIRLTESDLVRIVKKIIKEQDDKNIS
jgi:hypothetical protein